MNRDKEIHTAPAEKPEASLSGISRRKLLRAGAGASPILLTLGSGPVAANPFANNGTCTLASSFISVATFQSRNPGVNNLKCSQQNADYWRAQAVPVVPPAVPPVPALAVTVAALLGTTSSTYNTSTLNDVFLGSVGVQTAGELGTLQHLIALALNLNAGFLTTVPGFDLPYLQSIWLSYKANGNRYKKPGSEIDWGDAEIIAWARLLLGYTLLP